MKLRWVFLIGLGFCLVAGAIGFGAAALFQDRNPWIPILAGLCAMLLIFVPAVAGIMITNLTFDLESSDGQRILRPFISVVVGFQLLGIVGLVFVAVAVPESIAFPIGAVVLSIVFLLGSIRFGTRLQRRIVAESEVQGAWSPWSPSVVRNKAVRVLVVFLIASVIGIGAFVGLGFAFGDETTSPLSFAVFGLSLGFLAASVACIVVVWPLMKNLRHALGKDYAAQKAIGRVVLRNKKDELSDDGRRRAAVWAAIMSVYFPFQTAQIALLFTALWLQQVWNLSSGPADEYLPFTIGMAVGIPVLLAVLLPFSIRQSRRVKRYAAAHAGLVDVADEKAPGTA